MTATAHALMGGAIAVSISNPAIGLSLATLSHPIIDMIPHWDLGIGWKKKTKVHFFMQSSCDLLLGLALAYLIFGRSVEPLYFWSAVFLSEVWDLLMVPYFFGFRFPPFSTFYNVQSGFNVNIKLPWGIFTQGATVLATVLILRVIH